MKINFQQLLAYVVVVVVSVGASMIAAKNSLDDTRALEVKINRQVAAALIVVDEKRKAALEVVCERDAATSASSIEVRKNQAKNDATVAQSKSVSPQVRKAKRNQVRSEKKSAAMLEKLKCVPTK